jgi:hypothetical protein
MSSVKITTLSLAPHLPFNTSLEDFFNTYTVGEDVECYKLFFCPFGTGSNFNDLNQIKFKSRIVILCVIDSIIDKNENTAINELLQFCSNHPENNFIIFKYHNFSIKEINIKNLYTDIIIGNTFTKKYKHCNKNIKTNKWISLNSTMRLHRIMAIYHLLSKEYYKNGIFTFNRNTSIPANFLNSLKIKPKISKQLKNNFLKGRIRFKNNDFNLLKKLPKFKSNVEFGVVDNYNINLLPIYEKIGIEIVTGTMFFENDTQFSEKEIQNIYGKNFPIYITGCGMAKEIKNFWNIDTFDDIIDHSYDEIEDPFERLTIAIDKNEKLLNGSINIKELWFDNQKRFEDNCDKMDLALYDRKYQNYFNEKIIKKSLSYFNVSCKHKTKGN